MQITLNRKKKVHLKDNDIELSNLIIKYDLSDLITFYENKDFVYFLDTNVDKTKQTLLLESIINTKKITQSEIGRLLSDYLLIIIDKSSEKIIIYRDLSGIKTAYYGVKDEVLYIGLNMHNIAKSICCRKFDSKSIFDLLYSGYLMEGKSFYDGVIEFPIGSETIFNKHLKIEYQNIEQLVFAEKDNNLSEHKNIEALRFEMCNAHQYHVSRRNNILLSGGIDSVAMLVVLDDIVEKENIYNYSFKVKDTEHDETLYAKNIADFLITSIEIIEVDPNDENNYSDFEEKILNMNNPYNGIWIFGNFKGNSKEIYYGGQDTRLHTPAIDSIDILAFYMLNIQKSVFYKPFLILFQLFRTLLYKLDFDKSTSKYIRGIYKICSAFDIKYYIDKYFFKIDKKKIEKLGLPMEGFDDFKKKYSINFENIINSRHLYNEIVKVKWKEQYVYDIRYMQDMGRINNTYMAMPFYNMQLAKFSSSIPWKLATKQVWGRKGYGSKKILINKFILREALKDKLNDTIYFRGKAVSQTIHQLFNGVLGRKIREVLLKDINESNSFIKEYNLEKIVEGYLLIEKWAIGSEEPLLRIHYIAAFCIYNREVLSKK